ncbi:hypothetical protein V9K67_24165 [Paraflavisolibacter sp. H34]|uniref:hypothetical protein n=1 Tax=Huijunlia imazamoxiresistens TaxID=3127457 RepID=UPI00301A1AAE
MKKAIFVAGLLLFMAGTADAQEPNRIGKQDTALYKHPQRGANDPAWDKNKRMRDRHQQGWKARPDSGAPAPVPDSMSNRRIYKSPKTKQKATPTGQEATGTNSTNAPNPKNAGKSQPE